MGGCTEICSDKTGTLTANKMTAVAFWVEGKNHDNSEIRNSTGDDNATIHKDIAQLKTIKEIADAVLINSSAYESVDAKTGELELKGNPTEKALFQFFTKAGCRMDNDQAEDMKKKLIFSTPFDSKKKFSLAAYYLEDKSVRIVFKGAPDYMVKFANRIAKADGEVVPFTDDDRKEFNEVIDANCLECYRTIMVAYKDMKKIEWDLFLEKNDVNSKDDAE
jgi:magnesium-transporting ATPase (P-type)